MGEGPGRRLPGAPGGRPAWPGQGAGRGSGRERAAGPGPGAGAGGGGGAASPAPGRGAWERPRGSREAGVPGSWAGTWALVSEPLNQSKAVEDSPLGGPGAPGLALPGLMQGAELTEGFGESLCPRPGMRRGGTGAGRGLGRAGGGRLCCGWRGRSSGFSGETGWEVVQRRLYAAFSGHWCWRL